MRELAPVELPQINGGSAPENIDLLLEGLGITAAIVAAPVIIIGLGYYMGVMYIYGRLTGEIW